MEKGLGRVYIPDERDNDFLMKSILPSKAPERTYRYWWSNGWWGDQGSTSQCVAYAWIHWLEDGPVTQNLVAPPLMNPYELYKEAQRNDVWHGENYDGTSVRAGAKVAHDKGFISSYYWANQLNQVIQAVLTTGPVVVGTNWYMDMFYPDPDGVIKIGGYNAGGHAYLICGVNTKTKMFRIKNSWGREWGKNGFAYISFADMERLINEHGEACLGIEIKKI